MRLYPIMGRSVDTKSITKDEAIWVDVLSQYLISKATTAEGLKILASVVHSNASSEPGHRIIRDKTMLLQVALEAIYKCEDTEVTVSTSCTLINDYITNVNHFKYLS